MTAKTVKRIISLILAVACIFALGACSKEGKTPSDDSSVKEISQYSDIYEVIAEKISNNFYAGYGDSGFFATDDMVVEDAESSVTTDSVATNGAAEPEYSGTNVQVNGVDEGDILKTDGKYIYILRSGYLTIVEASTLRELCSVPVEGREYASINQMYVSGDTLAAVFYVDEWYKHYIENGDKEYKGDYGQETAVVIYDISDRAAPKVINTLSQDGYYISSRMIGSKLYIVSCEQIRTGNIDENDPETFVPAVYTDGAKNLIACEDICIFPEIDSVAYNIITCIDVEGAQQYASVKAALGGNATVYADADSLVLGLTNYKYDESEGVEDGKNYIKTESRYDTSVLLYDLDDGNITERASGTVPGSLLNQFSIDEYNGYYRFVTTDSRWIQTVYTDGLDQYEYDSSDSNGLYVLDSELNIVGQIDDLAEGENVKSVRFDGDVAYFVTFRQVDPLFTVDLSEPNRPKIMSELKIPGFSSYLHKFGEGRLLGLGFDADEETGWTQGLKLSMFDISNPYDVTEKHKLILDEYWSEATYNHKAILVSVDKNLIAFPAESGYVVYGYDDDSGFYLKNEVEIENYFYYAGNSRGLFIGDSFYVCCDRFVEAFSLDDFDGVGRLELSELPETEY